jgi:hypothetical protein
MVLIERKGLFVQISSDLRPEDVASVRMLAQRRDLCKGVRATYGASLQFLAANGWIVGVVSGLPSYTLIVAMINIHSSSPQYFVADILGRGLYVLFTLITLVWILGLLSVWRVLPNLLTVTIFSYTSLAHWSIISFLILMVYGWGMLPLGVFAYLTAILVPGTLVLLFCGDLLRIRRRQMFQALEANATAAAVPAVGATAPTVT